MHEVARLAGIELCLVDPGVDLGQQGPFDAIIHKLRPNQGACALARLPGRARSGRARASAGAGTNPSMPAQCGRPT
jgi:hypothetical protein